MGKKRIASKSGGEVDQGLRAKSLAKAAKKRIDVGILYVESTYNNTRVLLTDKSGNAVCASSSGSLGFTGAKKGTPFAAAKVGELIGEKGSAIGVKNVDVVIKGVGAGREAAVRAFSSKGIGLLSIKDITPMPHNGPKAKKPRRI
ncbi:MAG: 30S ribosomal protein S11 [Patescibacteria group bacterium]